MIHIDRPSLENCYALTRSYGEICTGCNCCGRFETGKKMWEARLDYHKECLVEEINFDRWTNDPEILKIQKVNNKKNIVYQKDKIKECEKILSEL